MAKCLYVKSIVNNITVKQDELTLNKLMNILIRKISIDENGMSIGVYDKSDVTANILVELVSIKKKLNLKKWEFAAIVIDRLCIVLFLCANVISTIFIIVLQVKNINRN